MYLRDLAVFASKFEATSRFTKIFDVSTHIVVEPVLAWIPRNQVMLDDLAKLNVVVGKAESPDSRYSKWQGVGTCCVTDFDFEAYSRLAESAQQEFVLTLLAEAFRYVADQSRSDASPCFAAIQRVRQSGLPLPRLNSPAFWNALPPSKRRSKSFREHIEFSARIVDRDQTAQR
jgi:hypothetical protein